MEDYETIKELLAFDNHYFEHAFSIKIGEKVNMTLAQAAQLLRAEESSAILKVVLMDNDTLRIEHREYDEDAALNAVWKALRLYVRKYSSDPATVFEEPPSNRVAQLLAELARELPDDCEIVIRRRT